MADIKRRMSEQHETDIAELFAPFGGYKSKASGATESDKNDGRTDHFGRWPFSWDGKCTQGQSISVSLGMLRKLGSDAGTERPVLPLRFYANDQLDIVPGGDLVAFQFEDAREIIEALAELEVLRARVAEAMIVNVPQHFTDEQVTEFHRQVTEALESGQQPRWADPADSAHVPDETFSAMSAALIAAQDRAAELEGQVTEHRERADELARQLREAVTETKRRRGDDEAAERIAAVVVHDPGTAERLQAELAERDRQLAQADEENRLLRATLDATGEEPAAPQPDVQEPGAVNIPQLPWTEVRQTKLPDGRVRNTGVWWDAAGMSHPMMVTEIRLEPNGPHTERLMVNNRRIPAGDLYIGGVLRLRVGAR